MSSLRSAAATTSGENRRVREVVTPWYRSAVARSPKDAINALELSDYTVFMQPARPAHSMFPRMG